VTPEAAPTVATVLEQATRRLREAGVPDPRRDAASLLALVLNTDRGGVIARKSDPLAPEEAARFAELIAARESRKPLQHLEGHSEFRGLEFEVSPDVLIPRPETEDLVQAVLEAGLPDAARVADLGTGSGCIAVSLAVERPAWQVVAVDLSDDALRIAARNAAMHGVAGRVQLVARDFAEVPNDDRGLYDAVVSNPPYVPEVEWEGLQPEVRDYEPRLALVPGPTGNEAYEAVVRAAGQLLRPGGLLALELGWKSEEAVRAFVSALRYREIATRPDLQGIARVLTARKW
jgi:release factor glutamine methyltransferase